MASLSKFRVNSKAIEEGRWVSPGEEFDELMIKTRGFGDHYYDARAAKMRRAATAYGGNVDRIPNAVTREITIDCLQAHCLQDVKNLVDEDGKEVNFQQFLKLMRDPDYADLVVASLKAVAVVGLQREAEVADAKKK